tara:strand:+ start:179 stop:457 length:279 start_codon:yes stop_codon:yes gene_type:complete
LSEESPVFPYAFFGFPVCPSVNPVSVLFVNPVFANVLVPLGIGKGALPVPIAILIPPNMFTPTDIGIGALSMGNAVLPFTNVFVSTGKGKGA